jgi:CxxC motif-containing protein
MVKQMVCTLCPMGCQLEITGTLAGYQVKGNSCPRGQGYAIQEVTDPRRRVTSTMRVNNGNRKLVSVKSSEAIPKDRIFDVIQAISEIDLEAPIQDGAVLLANVLGIGIDMIATSQVTKKT